MKKYFSILVLLIISVSMFGQSIKALDEKFGFRDIKLEAPFSSFKNLKFEFANDYEGTKQYNLLGTDLQIGNYKLEYIHLHFYKDELYEIELAPSEGYANQLGILEIFQIAYGEGMRIKDKYDSGSSYYWDSSKVKLIYGFGDKSDPVGTILFTSNRILDLMYNDSVIRSNKEKEDQKELAKKL